MDWDQESELSCYTSVVERSAGIVQCAQVPGQEEWIAAPRDENVYGRNFYVYHYFHPAGFEYQVASSGILPLCGHKGIQDK